MELTIPPVSASELAAAFLQAAVTFGLMGLCLYLFWRYRKVHFACWAGAWAVYGLRIAAIVTFLLTTSPQWLYWHQVATGWSALGFLWAALVFSQQVRWKSRYAVLLAFPVIWSYVAIYRLDNFFLAAAPAVVFLSAATAWTGWTFFRYHRQLRSNAAALLAGTLFLWAVHHLDYPFLRARGAWNPWGYYLDILFSVAVGLGILLLVLEDVRGGLITLSEISGGLNRRGDRDDTVRGLLTSTLHLAGVHGTAMYQLGESGGVFTSGVGDCSGWVGTATDTATTTVIREAADSGRPRVLRGPQHEAEYIAALPIVRDVGVSHVMVITGAVRDPFAALDERFLHALAQQVGAAIDNAELYEKLVGRTEDLERLARQMVRQHEDERQRLSRELHDETAQVFSALKFQLGTMQDHAEGDDADRVERALTLVDAGIKSIRAVTRELRPSLLDDLGAVPALRALSHDFEHTSGLPVHIAVPPDLPELPEEGELALYRALQEAYSNIMKHAQAGSVSVTLSADDDSVLLTVTDDGIGLPPEAVRLDREREGHLGIPGMRERISSLGGTVTFGPGPEGGAQLNVRLPVNGGSADG